MFLKLLKYDVKSVWRIWWIMAASVFGMSLLGGVSLRLIITLMEEEKLVLLILLSGLLLIGCFMAILASTIITELLIYVRFYKNFFTDEGYLTFTLPVSRKDLLLAKTANAILWNTAQLVLILTSVFFVLLIGVPSYVGKEFFYDFHMVISSIPFEFGAWSFLYIIEVLIVIFFAEVFHVSLIHFCITMGAMLAKKAKILAAIGIYYAVNAVISFGSQILSMVLAMIMSSELYSVLAEAPQAMQSGMVAVILLIIGVVAAMLACVMYFITRNKLERNLNLA